MSILFSETVKVADDRSVSVEELPDGSIGVRGQVLECDGDIRITSIRFSEESLEAIRLILNRRSEKEEEK